MIHKLINIIMYCMQRGGKNDSFSSKILHSFNNFDLNPCFCYFLSNLPIWSSNCLDFCDLQFFQFARTYQVFLFRFGPYIFLLFLTTSSLSIFSSPPFQDIFCFLFTRSFLSEVYPPLLLHFLLRDLDLPAGPI